MLKAFFKGKLLRFLLLGLVLFECGITQVEAVVVTHGTSPSVAQVSGNLLEPVSLFTRTLYNICYIVGAMLIMGSIVQYRDHRHNSSQVPISRPVILLMLGLLLVLLPSIGGLSAGSSFLK